MKIETILIACDEGPMFLSFLPSVSYHWKSMGYRVAFGLVTSTVLTPEEEEQLRKHVDDLYIYNYDAATCPYTVIVMTKLFRFYISKYYPTSTVCVQDIDYYVFDKHEHIESKIRNPATEVFTHGYNAYYGNIIPIPTRKHFGNGWGETAVLPYIQGIEPGEIVFGTNGVIGIPVHSLPQTKRRLFIKSEIRFPATPMVAHGSMIYRIFSPDPTQTFDEFLADLARRQPTFAPPTMTCGSSVFSHTEFSDETLILQLNRTNGIQYYHTRRDDFYEGRAAKRIDPRCGSIHIDWIPGQQGEKYNEILHTGNILDIQPNRPLEDSKLMQNVFEFLGISKSLLDSNAAFYGTK
jgi:hypothetical protein